MRPIKAYFELDDKGTCYRFTLIQGVRGNYTFLKEPDGPSRLRFEGTQEALNLQMRDILGGRVARQRAIFFYVEQPDMREAHELMADLVQENRDLKAQLAVVAPSAPESIGEFPPEANGPRVPHVPTEAAAEARTPAQKRKATMALKRAGLPLPPKPKRRKRATA